jgi:hypothetical protein
MLTLPLPLVKGDGGEGHDGGGRGGGGGGGSTRETILLPTTHLSNHFLFSAMVPPVHSHF